MSEDSRTFTLKQVLSLLTAVTVMSGGGAALTVSASDAVQDSKIESLETHVSRVAQDTQEVRQAVAEVKAKVDANGKRTDEVRADIAELRGLIIRSLQRNAER